jgi:hypothetical protein
MRYVFVWVFPDFWTQCIVFNGNTFFESLVLSLNFFFNFSERKSENKCDKASYAEFVNKTDPSYSPDLARSWCSKLLKHKNLEVTHS